jgi:hypothetical protein
MPCAPTRGDTVDEWLPGKESDDWVCVDESKEHSELGVSGGTFSVSEVWVVLPGEDREVFSLLLEGLRSDFQLEMDDAVNCETPLRLCTVPVIVACVGISNTP